MSKRRATFEGLGPGAPVRRHDITKQVFTDAHQFTVSHPLTAAPGPVRGGVLRPPQTVSIPPTCGSAGATRRRPPACAVGGPQPLLRSRSCAGACPQKPPPPVAGDTPAAASVRLRPLPAPTACLASASTARQVRTSSPARPRPASPLLAPAPRCDLSIPPCWCRRRRGSAASPPRGPRPRLRGGSPSTVLRAGRE